MAGAPKGNQNAAKGREWAEAVRYALANYEDAKVERGKALKAIAMKLIEKALEGEKDAIQEIGNRLDGKPAQMISGDPDAPIQAKLTIEFVN